MIFWNSAQFRKNLVLADKELLTNIFTWLLSRIGPLKKRAYLARFLVKIELSPEVEGDQDVINQYKQVSSFLRNYLCFHHGTLIGLVPNFDWRFQKSPQQLWATTSFVGYFDRIAEGHQDNGDWTWTDQQQVGHC